MRAIPTPTRDMSGASSLEHVVRLQIQKLPEGVYIATSEDIQGLVAQGQSNYETIDIACDVARRLIDAQSDGYRHPFSSPLNGTKSC